jgi:hypothetical protein
VQYPFVSVLSTFFRLGVRFYRQGNFGWGEKQVKKTLATIFLMAMPAAGLAIEPLQNGSQETATTSTGSSTAKSHHSTHHKRSRKAHHKSPKHHTSKQHTQPQ